MRAAFHTYLTHAWIADRYPQAQPDGPARAAIRARHSRPSPRAHRARGLPRRLRTVLAAAGHDRYTVAGTRS
jgi:hypothetical protein